MKILSAELRDFKRFAHLRIEGIPATARLVILAGPNGCGKSSFFDALQLWYATSTGIGGHDPSYHQRSLTVANQVNIGFHAPVPGDQESRNKLFYFRSAGLIRENPISLIDRPKAEPAPRPHLDAEQSRLFLASVERSSLGSLFKLLIASGARSCEARALREEDVDLPVVYFRTKVRKVVGGWVTEPTLKSKTSKRAVTLPPFAAEAIELLLTGQGGLLWHQADGSPLQAHHVQAELDRICKAAGIPRVTIHGLRHTSATLLAHAGVAPQVIQHRLGHTKIGITMDRYARELTGGDAPAAEVLERIVRGTKEDDVR
jgi:integrase